MTVVSETAGIVLLDLQPGAVRAALPIYIMQGIAGLVVPLTADARRIGEDALLALHRAVWRAALEVHFGQWITRG